MKILVLGANGFIGSHALKYFRNIYPQTAGCDISMPKVPDENFFLLDGLNPRFDKLFVQNTFDVCINASGSGSVSFSLRKPEEDYRLNTKNVFDILTAISRYNTRCRFLNFSSAAVYGNPEELPVNEKSKTRPVSPYGFHKLISEQVCAEFFHLQGIRTCSMRVFSVYGEGLKKQLFWDIYQKTRQQFDVELFGTGEETRDFIHVQDLMLAIECILKKSSFNADVINVASGNPVSITHVASIITGIVPGISIRFNNQFKQGDPVHLEADISKLTSLGFEAKKSLNDGLTAYFNWAGVQTVEP